MTVLSDKPFMGKCGSLSVMVQCECGNVRERGLWRFLNSGERSCGCQRGWFRKLPLSEAAFNILYRTYKYNSLKASRPFTLTRDEFKVLTSSNCYYCGVPPKRHTGCVKTRTGDYPYNGVDRINNDEGYTSDNSVPCCMECNLMKRSMSMDVFIAHVRRIVANLKKVKA